MGCLRLYNHGMRWVVFLGLISCSGGAHTVEVGPPPPRATRGLLSGPMCDGPQCTCRDLDASDDGGVGVPADSAHKRFEIRMNSPQELWATVGTMRLYKSPAPQEACFYIDLPTGQTPVELRASDPNGAAGQWEIRELGTETTSFYDTFRFNCGVPGVCSLDELEAIKKAHGGQLRQVQDPCGSTKVKGLTWTHSKAPDALHPTDLIVRLSLDVYRFVPTKPHGDSSCGGGSDSASENAAPLPSDNP